MLGGRLFSGVTLIFHQFRGVWGVVWGVYGVSHLNVDVTVRREVNSFVTGPGAGPAAG